MVVVGYFRNLVGIAGLGALAAMPVGALAADLSVPAAAPAYTKAPMLAPVFSWTGFYIGGTAGAAWTKADVSLNTVNGTNPLYNPLDIPNLNAFGSPSLSQTNAIYGFKAGYNQQWGAWVLGVEGDISSFRFNRASTNSGNPFVVTFPNFGSGQMSTSVSTSWLSTIRARAGFAADHWLFYGTGGAAIANVGFSNNYVGFSPQGAGFEFENSSASGTRVGWAAGAGVEYAITPHWVLSAEYLHVDLGSISAAGLVTTGNANTATFNFSTKVTSDIARGGVAYKF
jgi:outer membrane immunogenic protein